MPSFAETATFGVEIEGTLPDSNRFSVAQYHDDSVKIPLTGKENEIAFFSAEHDGSIHPPADRKGIELVSPILSEAFGLFHLGYISEYLDELDFDVTPSCGLHVHVGAQELSEPEIKRIVNAFRLYERAFFALNGEAFARRWNNNCYCKRSELWTNPGADRFQSLNLTNVGRIRKNTLEFRLFASTSNLETLIVAVNMCVSIVAYAKDRALFDNYQGQLADNAEAVNRFIADVWGSDVQSETVIPLPCDEEPGWTTDPADYAKHLIEQLQKII